VEPREGGAKAEPTGPLVWAQLAIKEPKASPHSKAFGEKMRGLWEPAEMGLKD